MCATGLGTKAIDYAGPGRSQDSEQPYPGQSDNAQNGNECRGLDMAKEQGKCGESSLAWFTFGRNLFLMQDTRERHSHVWKQPQCL